MTEGESLSRREFLKKAGFAVVGMAACAFTLSQFFKRVFVEPGNSALTMWPDQGHTVSIKNDVNMYDVAIVGCGMAGAVAGLTALKKGMNVCIVEKKERDFIGRKICGELTHKGIVELLNNEFNLSIASYPLKGLEICCSSGYTTRIEGSLCMIDRWQVGQAMLEHLLDKGADIYQGTVRDPVLTSFVRGVKTLDSTVYSSVTIDCSGVSSVLRRKLFFERQHLGIAYKENLILSEPSEMEYAVLFLDTDMLPSGYAWCFPKNEYELNVGVGGLEVDGHSLEGTLEKVVEMLGIGSKVKRREVPGFGLVPLGGPLPSMVYPGLLVCGDAASQVNPLTGGGIAPAVTAGLLAGAVSADAVEHDDVSVKGMWRYNCDFAREYGGKHAALVIARDFLISLSDEELTYFLENIVGDGLSQLMKGEVSVQGDGLKTFFEHWQNPMLLIKAYRAFRQMSEIRSHYEQYPEGPEEFCGWRELLDQYRKLW